MPVIDWGENNGSITREEDGTFTAERNFFAKVDRGSVREAEVEQYRDCPRRGDPHPTERGARCTSVITRRRVPGNRLFDITATYSNRFAEPQEENPLDRRANIKMRSQLLELPSRIDTRGRLVENTAGDPIDGYKRRISARVIQVAKNVATWPEWTLTYGDAINSDVIRIRGRTFQQRTLRIGSVEIGDEEFENDVRYFPLSFSLEHNPLTWIQPYWNRGYYERVDGFTVTIGDEVIFARQRPENDGLDWTETTKLQRILINGEAPSEPQWLDAEGRHILKPTPEDVIRLEFQDYHELPFSRLPLS